MYNIQRLQKFRTRGRIVRVHEFEICINLCAVDEKAFACYHYFKVILALYDMNSYVYTALVNEEISPISAIEIPASDTEQSPLEIAFTSRAVNNFVPII